MSDAPTPAAAMPRPRRSRRGRREPVVPLPVSAIPRATYRVQLHRHFTFADVTALVPYLDALGISHVYCSPYLRARPGSRHGYDIVDHSMLNPEIGSREDFDRMVETLAARGMSHLCDVVPNHMAVMGEDNAWWMDVLEYGSASMYAESFDIDWSPQDADLLGKVLVPVLGEPYARVLERGELRLIFEPAAGSLAIRYFEHRFPIDPRTYARVLSPALAETDGVAGDAAEIERLLASIHALPHRRDLTRASVDEGRRLAGALKWSCAALAARKPAFAAAIEAVASRIGGTAGDPASFEAMHALLEDQSFRLAYWRVAGEEINYRRFFDINELAALRMEDDPTFEATHALVLGLAADGKIGGLRIDHPDGLYDPAAYFARLQRRYREETAKRRAPAPGDAPAAIYVALEKITAPHEHLPETWPVHGTTGYRFANVLNGLFVDTTAKARVDRAWRAFVGGAAQTFEQACDRGRRMIMDSALAAELGVLTTRALRIARGDRRTRDFTFNALRRAIEDIVAHFPVYRTYVDADGPSAQDRRHVDWAVTRARAGSRTSDSSLFEFLHRLLLGLAPDDAGPAMVLACRQFAMRFQQFTSPVAAKGVEDTALYTFNRLVSLNDVGGDPEQFGMALRAFHGASADRAAVWPNTMLASSTHDNKRSEDVRARIDVISERPAAWRLAVRRWSRLNRSRKHIVDGEPAPSRNDEYLLYQTLVGTLPTSPLEGATLASYRERITGYMVKAAREAKVHTSWFAVGEPYEHALADFVSALLRDGDDRFLADLRAQAAVFAWFGGLNSVSMALVKLTSPGVPDIYQGNEMIDLSLVDPDNRRPVDYEARRAHLASFGAAEGWQGDVDRMAALWEDPADGRAKLWVTARSLALRRRRPSLFAAGDYRPLNASGAHAEHVVAFARRHDGDAVVSVAGRLFASLGLEANVPPCGDAWSDTALVLPFAEDARVFDALSGRRVDVTPGPMPLRALFASCPWALLYVEPCGG